MGPRSVDRGRLGLIARCGRRVVKLQWGHDQLIVEGRRLEPGQRRCLGGLQWGHDQLIVEGGVTSGNVCRAKSRFNGATIS